MKSSRVSASRKSNGRGRIRRRGRKYHGVSKWWPPVRFPDGTFQPTQENPMKFLSMIRIQENTGQKPSERLMTEMGKLMEEAFKAGWLVSTAGLTPTAKGARVRSNHGKVTRTDG